MSYTPCADCGRMLPPEEHSRSMLCVDCVSKNVASLQVLRTTPVLADALRSIGVTMDQFAGMLAPAPASHVTLQQITGVARRLDEKDAEFRARLLQTQVFMPGMRVRVLKGLFRGDRGVLVEPAPVVARSDAKHPAWLVDFEDGARGSIEERCLTIVGASKEELAAAIADLEAASR